MIRMIDALRSAMLAAGLLGMAQTAAAQSPDGSFSSPIRFMQRDGEVIYRTVCQGCHMPAGQGAVGAGAYPALVKNEKLAASGYPVLVVVKGSKGMPPFASHFDDDQVAAVVNFVRTHFGNAFDDAVTAADVKAARQ